MQLRRAMHKTQDIIAEIITTIMANAFTSPQISGKEGGKFFCRGFRKWLQRRTRNTLALLSAPALHLFMCRWAIN